MRLVFCSDPLEPRRPDSSFADEAAAAERLGIGRSLVNFEALAENFGAERAVHRVSPAPEDGEGGVFRGWMMTPERYAELYEALADRRVMLVNTPAQYEHCHHLPNWYGRLEGHTPRSVWTDADDMSLPRLMVLLRDFGDCPVIVKDYVKSRKHEWLEACFIPSASDAQAVDRVVGRFLGLQGDGLSGGLVLREFVEFEPLGDHQKSGMPLTREFRLFFLDGEVVQVSRYWDQGDYHQGDYQGETPPLAHFTRLASSVGSRFFTMDVAKTTAGEWLVVELGDAQVAELPEDADTDGFFTRLKQKLNTESGHDLHHEGP